MVVSLAPESVVTAKQYAAEPGSRESQILAIRSGAFRENQGAVGAATGSRDQVYPLDAARHASHFSHRSFIVPSSPKTTINRIAAKEETAGAMKAIRRAAAPTPTIFNPSINGDTADAL